jgi:hypothetical protein
MRPDGSVRSIPIAEFYRLPGTLDKLLGRLPEVR